jgi:hypothetical protein
MTENGQEVEEVVSFKQLYARGWKNYSVLENKSTNSKAEMDEHDFYRKKQKALPLFFSL